MNSRTPLFAAAGVIMIAGLIGAVVLMNNKDTKPDQDNTKANNFKAFENKDTKISSNDTKKTTPKTTTTPKKDPEPKISEKMKKKKQEVANKKRVGFDSLGNSKAMVAFVPPAQSCFFQAKKDNPDLFKDKKIRDLDITIFVEANGENSRLTAIDFDMDSPLHETKFESCVMDKLNGVNFPKLAENDYVEQKVSISLPSEPKTPPPPKP